MNVLTHDNNKSGFTLLEVLIALVILAVGILGVATMQISAIQGNSRGRQVSEATSVASALMENLLAREYGDDCLVDSNGDGAVGLDNDLETAEPPDHPGTCLTPVQVPLGYILYWNIADDEPVTDTKTIRIFVVGPQVRSFSLTAFKADL